MIQQRSHRRPRWAVPRSGRERPGADGPGLSWEGEGTDPRTRPPNGQRALLWRAVAVVAVGVLLALLGLAMARGMSGSADETAVPGREDASSSEVAVGDCLASLPGAGGTELDVLPCSEQHVGEVVAVVDLSDDTGPGGHPGEDVVRQQVRSACAEGFERYVGVPATSSELGLVALPPAESAWRLGGERAAVCIAEGAALVGSVRGSGR